MSENWDSIRAQYQGILKNLLNNIDICNERYLKEGEIGYMIQRDVYIKELTEMKTMIKQKEKMNMYKQKDSVTKRQSVDKEVLFLTEKKERYNE